MVNKSNSSLTGYLIGATAQYSAEKGIVWSEDDLIRFIDIWFKHSHIKVGHKGLKYDCYKDYLEGITKHSPF